MRSCCTNDFHSPQAQINCILFEFVIAETVGSVKNGSGKVSANLNAVGHPYLVVLGRLDASGLNAPGQVATG